MYLTRIFCEVCAKEVQLGNRPGPFLSSKGYKNLEDNFFSITKKRYVINHLPIGEEGNIGDWLEKLMAIEVSSTTAVAHAGVEHGLGDILGVVPVRHPPPHPLAHAHSLQQTERIK